MDRDEHLTALIAELDRLRRDNRWIVHEVLVAAHVVLVREGPAALSVRTVAAQARLSPSAMQHRVGSMELLVGRLAATVGGFRLQDLQRDVFHGGLSAWLPAGPEHDVRDHAWLLLQSLQPTQPLVAAQMREVREQERAIAASATRVPTTPELPRDATLDEARPWLRGSGIEPDHPDAELLRVCLDGLAAEVAAAGLDRLTPDEAERSVLRWWDPSGGLGGHGRLGGRVDPVLDDPERTAVRQAARRQVDDLLRRLRHPIHGAAAPVAQVRALLDDRRGQQVRSAS